MLRGSDPRTMSRSRDVTPRWSSIRPAARWTGLHLRHPCPPGGRPPGGQLRSGALRAGRRSPAGWWASPPAPRRARRGPSRRCWWTTRSSTSDGLALARWMAGHYLCPLRDALRCLLPPGAGREPPGAGRASPTPAAPPIPDDAGPRAPAAAGPGGPARGATRRPQMSDLADAAGRRRTARRPRPRWAPP